MRRDDQERPALSTPSRTFPADPDSAAVVRRAVEEAIGPVVPPPVLADAVLLASELASNAIMHARTPFTFRVDVEWPIVAMEAVDMAPGPLPPVAPPPPFQPSGRGLWLIDQLATRWGCSPEPGGKRIWLELEVAEHVEQGGGQGGH